MKTIDLHTPISEYDLQQLKAGDLITISGTIYTARDKAHKKIAELVAQQKSLPIDFTNAVLYYAGPSPAPPGTAYWSYRTHNIVPYGLPILTSCCH